MLPLRTGRSAKSGLQLPRALSNTLLCLGALLLGIVVAAYARASYRQAELKREWSERQVIGSVAAAALPGLATSRALRRGEGGSPRSPATVADVPAFREGDAVARLRIPRIGLDAVVLEGISKATLAVAPGHYPGMAYPGEGGHSVIAAHRDSFFKRAGELEPGDRIAVTRWDRRDIEYRVSRNYIVHKTDRTVIVPTDGELLTLITCYPFVYVGHAPYRFIIQAVPVNGPAAR